MPGPLLKVLEIRVGMLEQRLMQTKKMLMKTMKTMTMKTMKMLMKMTSLQLHSQAPGYSKNSDNI